MKKKTKYNYTRYTILFDLDIVDEKAMVEYLESHKGKRNGFSTQLKKALKKMIDEEKAQLALGASLGKKPGER